MKYTLIGGPYDGEAREVLYGRKLITPAPVRQLSDPDDFGDMVLMQSCLYNLRPDGTALFEKQGPLKTLI